MRLPGVTFLLMASAAIAVGFSGVWLARKQSEERTPVDRHALREFSDAVDAELNRLQDRYEQNLREVAAGVSPRALNEARERCAAVHGIRGCTFLPLPSTNATPVSFVVPTEARDGVPSVLPRSATLGLANAETLFLVDTSMIAAASDAGGAPSGWIVRGPGNPFTGYWMRNSPQEAVVLMIDWRQVTAQTDRYLRDWITAPYAPLQRAGAGVRFLGPNGALLAGGTAEPARSPDFLLPMRKRQGEWQLAAWDDVRTVTSYDPAILSAAILGAALLIIVGLLLYQRQRDALRLAEARVTFVNRVSHELGTPLTNMLLNLDLAAEQLRASPEKASGYLALVTQEADRLSRLVKNVLTFSRAERGRLELQTRLCLPDQVIESVLQQFGPAFSRAGIAVDWQPGAAAGVTLDSDALAQITGNLLSNVEKYAASGKRVAVSSRWRDGELFVRVEDAGPGIPAADRARIFRPFERVRQEVSEGASGTGLGLAIAAELATRMGGNLDLLPSDTGAVFELRVPAPGVLSPVERQPSEAA